jgi:hypothetical protein
VACCEVVLRLLACCEVAPQLQVQLQLLPRRLLLISHGPPPTDLHRLLHTDAREIGAMLRHPAAGGQIKGCVESFPRLELSAQLQPITRSVLRVQLTIKPRFNWKDRAHGQVGTWLGPVCRPVIVRRVAGDKVQCASGGCWQFHQLVRARNMGGWAAGLYGVLVCTPAAAMALYVAAGI